MSAPRLIDTHCHLNFNRYDEDREEVLRRAREAGVARIIIPAIDLASCQQALAYGGLPCRLVRGGGRPPQ